MTSSKFIKLKTEPLRVEFTGNFVIEDKGLYEFFKQYSAEDYDMYFERALRLGAYALEEERIAAFLGRAESELDAGLERLKIIYKMAHLKEKTAAKGPVAERELADVLQEYIDEIGWKDEVVAVGNTQGMIARRKVGDLIVRINGSDLSVVIEAKMDKSFPTGDPAASDERDKRSGSAEKSAYGQNLTALVNRGAQVAIAVFDDETSSRSVADLEPITFHPELPGFIVKVNRAQGSYFNLTLAYALAREMALMGVQKVHGDHLNLLVKRMLRDVETLANTESALEQIEEGANTMIEGVNSMRDAVTKSRESLLRTQEILRGVLAGETPSLDQMRIYYNEAGERGLTKRIGI